MNHEKNRTLYVGNLDPAVNEKLLCTLFARIGPVNSSKVIRESASKPYAFLEFDSHSVAATAMATMNGRLFLDKEMRVNWAATPGGQPKLDTSSHFHVFVGDLAPEIVPETLRAAFAPFGEISNCRIVQDALTSKPKGYAFVSFFQQSDAANAIKSMNGQLLGSRIIRTNWSIRNPPPSKATLDDVYNQSSPTNCTVYCGGISEGLTEELMKQVFFRFGTIVDIRAFEDKGYAFIKFSTKEAATIAIEAVHHTEINGRQVNCFWGREAGDPYSAAHLAGLPLVSTDAPASQHSTSNMNCNQGMNYGYPNAQMQDQHAQGGQDQHAHGRQDQHARGGQDQHARGGQDQHARGGQDQHARGGQDQHARGAQDQYVRGVRDVQDQYVRGVQDQYVLGVQDQYVQGVQDQYVRGVQDQYVQRALDQFLLGAQDRYVQGGQDQYVQGAQNQYVQSMQNQYAQSMQNQYVQATNFGGPSAHSQYIDYNYELANSTTYQIDNGTEQAANGQQMPTLDDTPAGVYSSQYQSQ